MSGYANTNYGPPPMGQSNLMNGLPAASQHPPGAPGATAGIVAPPPSFSTAEQQFQQQQQILQQKQQLQQQQQQQQQPPQLLLSQPGIGLQSNMSKFLPPTSNVANGPAPARPLTAATTASQAPVSNLPPHMRPPGMNSTPGGGGGSVPLTNGGGGSGDLSTNSSRTASPSLAQQTQYGAHAARPPLSQAPSGNVTPTNPQYAAAASVQGLSGSMQNLSINRNNGMPAANTNPSQQQSFPQNYQDNFRTNAMNAPTPLATQPPGAQANMPPPISSAPFAGNRPLQPPTAPTVNTSHSQTAPTQTLNSTAGVPPTSTQYPLPPASNAAMFGTSRAPPLVTNASLGGQQQALPVSNANYTPGSTTGATQPPLPTASVAQQQNQLNNNTQQQSSTQRRPMYPTGPMPPMPGTALAQPQQQQQAQQPYGQVYQQPQQQQQQQQPPQPQPGLFNGQPNTAPLQYQSQPYMQQPSPQQVLQKHYPPQQQQQQQQQNYPTPSGDAYNQQMSVTQAGFSRLWGQDTIDLMQNRHILSPATLQPPRIVLNNQFHESINCNQHIMRCTMAKIPESNSLLQKSRLPLGILIHPFRDINSLPVIQCPSIVRCRLCRTYINPFVYFVDSKMWKCNLCYRVNELPDDFQYDPATKTYGDVTRRPEVRSSTIEFIAPSEYMLRPPQPAVYLFLFDVSIIAQQSGYLENVCALLNNHLDGMPGDARTQIGFIAYNSQVHFYSMAEGYNQPHELTLIDIDDPFLPRPDNLLVNLKECRELVSDLLTQLPSRFADTHDPGSALGAALQVAYKLMQSHGGRVTVFQTCLPNKGPGSLEPREDPNNRSAKDVAHLNPATDFYKRYALECSAYQIAVDLFLLNQQYSDLATISGISKHSGGCVYHFPLYQKTKLPAVESLKQCFKRYLVRKIGFEAVMRIRCTRGLQVHTFHGNFFVRSTDLLSLPNVNPDAGYGMQISYDESLSEAKTVCFQAALLYTNSDGERRIRVHTMCLPVTSSLPEVMHAADTEAIISLLSKMAVDRSLTSNVADAREAFINATVDIFNAFKIAQNLPSGQTGQLIAPRSLALLPIYISALLKHPAFRIGTSTRLDDRVYAMDCMKSLPLDQLMKFIYPEFYLIDSLFYPQTKTQEEDDDDDVPELPRLQLSAEFLDSRSIFLLDCGHLIILYVGLNAPASVLEDIFGVKSTAEIPDYSYGLPNLESTASATLKKFILHLNDDKPYTPLIQIIRDTSTAKPQFIEKLVDDRSESSLSYYEFLQHIRTQVK